MQFVNIGGHLDALSVVALFRTFAAARVTAVHRSGAGLTHLAAG